MKISPLPPPYYINEKPSKGKNIRLIIGLVILFVAISFLLYVFVFKKEAPADVEEKSIVKSESELPKEDELPKEEVIIPTINADEDIEEKKDLPKDGFLFPSDQKLFDKDDLLKTEIGKLELMKNEIYARHGYVFKDKEMQNYFNNQAWYSPREDYKPEDLNEIEIENLKIISEFLIDKPEETEE
ncbi:MAG: YARHG domain-containing protein [Ezakiella sp.]|nr:YARHG domain-containing protein [Ezakiella sp.]